MHSAYLWQLWPGRNWPFSPEEEQALLIDLESLNSKTTSFDRGDVTAVLNMIRLGLTFDAVKVHAPGLQPGRLLAAYTYLERRRSESEEAFEALLATPTEEQLALHEAASSRLIPIPTFWISRAIREGEAPAAKAVASYVHKEVTALSVASAQLEHRLASTPYEPDRYDECMALGRALYNPYEECLWARPFYLPSRVGALMPPRVSDLLGETS